ncbi:hypothetical protein D3C72_666120 [compost metagenome]
MPVVLWSHFVFLALQRLDGNVHRSKRCLELVRNIVHKVGLDIGDSFLADKVFKRQVIEIDHKDHQQQ